MKILQINCVYNTGSTGKLVNEIRNYLISKQIPNAIFYGNGEKSQEKGVIKFGYKWGVRIHVRQARYFGMQYNHSNFATNKLLRKVKSYNPDVVHLHCLNGYWINIYRLLNYLKKKKIKTVLTLHAEFMHTGNCAHAEECEKWKTGCGQCPRLREATGSYLFDRTHLAWKKMNEAFKGFGENIILVSVSDWLKERARLSPIMDGLKHITIQNGVDTKIFSYKENAKEKYKKYLDKKLIIHVTPDFNNKIKGGKYVLELAKHMPEFNFLIVGYRGDYDLPKNVYTISHTNNQQELAELYSIACCTLLTSKRETFSMVVAESLCCGTPVCAFEAGGPETIAIKEYCDFAPYGNIDILKEKIEKTTEKVYDKKEISITAMKKYDSTLMCKQYLQIYNKMNDDKEN